MMLRKFGAKLAKRRRAAHRLCGPRVRIRDDRVFFPEYRAAFLYRLDLPEDAVVDRLADVLVGVEHVRITHDPDGGPPGHQLPL